MAKPATVDGYSDQYTLDCERVLVTLLRGLGPWKESVYLVGGLTPRYLVKARPPVVPAHAGTLDVDIVIDLQILADTQAYHTLEDNLKKMGFERAENDRQQKLSWRWQTRTEHGALMVLELLADAPDIAGGKVQPLPTDGTISALNIPHSSIVFDLHQITEIQAELLGGNGVVIERIKHANLVSFTCLKAFAFDQRFERKGAHDLIYCLEHAPESPDVVAEVFREALEGKHHDVVKSALDILRIRFAQAAESEGYRKDGPVAVAILDNGRGMTERELLDAMRHGTANPRQQRSPRDLGRFGLGLKTASFSQCRSLTVASAREGMRCGAEWNLDRIDSANDWILSILDNADIDALPYIGRIGAHGTAVVWRELDRLVEDEAGDRRDEIVSEKLDALGRHLSLVFHRFLVGDAKGYPRISIVVNGHTIEAFDPFCRKNPATQLLPEEVVRIGDAEVRLQPYVLPHHSRLTAREYDFYQSRSDFISNQGAYIYRNGRLMAWGDWFRLVPKGEATKLARVQVDFPNSLDEAWTIDIKKSRARPPAAVRERLGDLTFVTYQPE